MVLLDTDICVAGLRGLRAPVDKIDDFGRELCSISVITVAELLIGVYESNRRGQNLDLVEQFVSDVTVVPLDRRILLRFAELRILLRRLGTPIEDFDLMIASTAIAVDMTLVTNNVRHYQRIPGLRIEQWIVP